MNTDTKKDTLIVFSHRIYPNHCHKMFLRIDIKGNTLGIAGDFFQINLQDGVKLDDLETKRLIDFIKFL